MYAVILFCCYFDTQRWVALNETSHPEGTKVRHWSSEN